MKQRAGMINLDNYPATVPYLVVKPCPPLHWCLACRKDVVALSGTRTVKASCDFMTLCTRSPHNVTHPGCGGNQRHHAALVRVK